MFKKILICALALCVLSPSAYAAVEQIGTGNTVKITGSVGEKNVPVGIQVFSGDKTIADLDSVGKDEYIGIIIYQGESVTDGDGNYEFTFDINTRSGEYTAYTGTGYTDSEPEEFVFISSGDYYDTAVKVNTATKEEIEKMLSENTYELGINDEILESIDESGLASVLYETLKDTKYDPEDREASWKIMDRVLFVQRLNEGKISSVYDAGSELNAFDDTAVKDWYGKDYVTQELKSNLTQRLSGKAIESYEAYKELLVDSFILATVNYPNGISNVKNIMTAFEERIGIDAGDADSSVWRTLAGGDFENLKALKDEFDDLKDNDDSGSSSGSGSSKSSGSAGGYKSISSVELPTQNTQNVSGQKISDSIFDDIDGVEWAKEAITALAERQIINGVGDYKFSPDTNITREQFCKIVINAFVPDSEEKEISFSDVDDSEWYASFVKKAYAGGIVNGMGDNRFGTGLSITRQDMCVMIYNAAKAAGLNLEAGEKQIFADDGAIADYAKDAVYALRNSGAVSGVDADTFSPSEYATRAQAAKIIYSLIKEM